MSYYAEVLDGSVAREVRPAATYTSSSGVTVSWRSLLVDADYRASLGLVPLQEVKPAFDELYQTAEFDRFEVQPDKVLKHYVVMGKAAEYVKAEVRRKAAQWLETNRNNPFHHDGHWFYASDRRLRDLQNAVTMGLAPNRFETAVEGVYYDIADVPALTSFALSKTTPHMAAVSAYHACLAATDNPAATAPEMAAALQVFKEAHPAIMLLLSQEYINLTTAPGYVSDPTQQLVDLGVY